MQIKNAFMQERQQLVERCDLAQRRLTEVLDEQVFWKMEFNREKALLQ